MSISGTGNSNSEFQIRGVGTVAQRSALRTAVQTLKNTKPKYDLSARLGANLTKWPIQEWDVDADYEPIPFQVHLNKPGGAPGNESRPTISVSHAKKLGRFKAFHYMESNTQDFARMLSPLLPYSPADPQFDVYITACKKAKAELKIEILQDLIIPILIHWIDTEDFVQPDLDLSTATLRQEFYMSMCGKWQMIFPWFFDELVGNLLDMPFIFSNSNLHSREAADLRTKCQEQLLSRFMIYIDAGMTLCIAHDTTDSADGFFRNRDQCYIRIEALNRQQLIKNTLPELGHWPSRSELTSNNSGPWTSRKSKTHTHRGGRGGGHGGRGGRGGVVSGSRVDKGSSGNVSRRGHLRVRRGRVDQQAS